MTKPEKFRYVIDAKRFNVKSPHIDIPCASIRACTMKGGKASNEKVLIFFDDEAAEKFNNEWMKGAVTQSKITDRWYMVLNLSEDVSPEHHSFLRAAARTSDLSGKEVPIETLYFTIRYEKGVVKPYLAGIFGFSNTNTKEETEEMGKKDKTVLDVWNTFTEDQKNTVYFMIAKAIEDRGIKIPLPASQKASIHKIIFNGPATVVFWTDGTKTIVRYNDETETIDDREKAVFAACAKKLLGTNATGSNYLDRIKPAFDKAQEEWTKRIIKKEEN